VHVALSGQNGPVGRAIRDGAALAIEELGAPLRSHGLDVSMVSLDDRGDPQVAASNARRDLVGDPSVLLVIGHSLSGASIAAAAVYDDAGLPMITPACEVATLTDSGYRAVFRVIGRDDVQGVAAARFGWTHMRGKTAYVAYEPGEYGLRTAAGFWWEGRRLGMRVAGLLPVEAATLDGVVAAIALVKPDLVYYGGGSAGAAKLLSRMRARGDRTPLIGADALDTSEFAYFAGGAAPQTTYTILDGPPAFYPGASGFAGRFRARFGRDPEPFAALAYDAAGAGLRAIARASEGYTRIPARGSVLAALHDPAFRFEGITGTVQFTPNGHRLHSPVFVMQVRISTWARWRVHVRL